MSLATGNGGASGQGAGQHGGAADLLWDDVSCFFDPDLMGSLPDVRVPGARWGTGRRSSSLSRRRAGSASTPKGAWCSRCPGRSPCSPVRQMPSARTDEIDFDVDLRELQGQERLDAFCGFLRGSADQVTEADGWGS